MALKCLIVEDAPFMREIYRYMLANSDDIEIVAEADDGEKALACLAEHKPDLVLLDLVLPVINGIEVMQKISDISPNSKVVVITSLEIESVLNQAKALGAIACLQKPFTKQQILDVIIDLNKTYQEVQNG